MENRAHLIQIARGQDCFAITIIVDAKLLNIMMAIAVNTIKIF